MIKNGHCKVCQYYKTADFSASHGKISINYNPEFETLGECRRYPPILIKGKINDCEIEYFGFPWIMPHSGDDKINWCGEFKLRENVALITKIEENKKS